MNDAIRESLLHDLKEDPWGTVSWQDSGLPIQYRAIRFCGPRGCGVDMYGFLVGMTNTVDHRISMTTDDFNDFTKVVEVMRDGAKEVRLLAMRDIEHALERARLEQPRRYRLKLIVETHWTAEGDPCEWDWSTIIGADAARLVVDAEEVPE